MSIHSVQRDGVDVSRTDTYMVSSQRIKSGSEKGESIMRRF